MSTRIVGTHVVAIAVLLGSVAAGQVFSVLPAAPPGPTELDRAYHYSTIGQELAYAKASQEPARKPDKATPGLQPPVGGGVPSLPLQAPGGVNSLLPVFCPGVSALCPSPSRLMSRLEAAGCRL